ncbi:protein transport protein SEC24 C-like [Tasmannia lanceolata]|uniref:protein transport protein SEC24 C-like n=1 Tax=Tasmannia lanceolata TaxID=3420 RepID=UPI004064C39D
MASPVPPRVPRPGYGPPNLNPNLQRTPDYLSDNMQNLQINRPPGPPSAMPYSSGPRPPPPFANSPFSSSSSLTPPMSSYPAAAPVSRPGPPPSGFPRAAAPPTGPPQSSPAPNLASGRPSVPPFSQPPPFGLRAAPPQGPFPSAPSMTGPIPQPSIVQGAMSNGPSVFSQGTLPGGPRFPSAGIAQQPPVVPPPMASSPRAPPGQSIRPFPGSPPYNAPLGAPSQLAPPSFAASQGMQSPMATPYGSQMWQMQSRPGAPLIPSSAQPPRMYGMPPPPTNQHLPPVPPIMGHMSASGASITGPSKIDPNQIPRPIPSSSVILFETRQNNQAGTPPSATSDFMVKDTGNCSPRYMRCTINQIPCSGDLLTTSSMQLALMVQPLALPHPSEEPIQIVDFGEGGPVRCSRCKGYINPFMKFIDQGRRFICNLCGFTDETPRDYHCNLGPDGRRRDADERPELCRGTVEFVATKEYMVREPMPAVFFFIIDVSMNAMQTGATAAACSAISQAIADLPESPRTMVGIATFDSTIHFYNLKRALQQPLMLIVPDIQDVYTPLETDVIVQLAECRQHLEQLLETIPTMFQNNRVVDSAFGAAIKAAFLAMKSTGGRLLVFQSVLPSVGIGALSAREAEGRTNVSAGEKEVHKLLQPADKTLKTMAIELAEYQVCVDIFITTQTYMDIASISVVPRTTGGQVYYYYPFSALSDSAKLYNDLRWNISRPQGLEAVMRVRCSQGLQLQEYSGNFCKRIPTDVDLPGIDCDKTIMVTFKHDDKFQEGSECAFQCALLYTTVYGQRRIRVHTLSLQCTTVISNLFRSADLDTQFTCFLKQAGNEIPTTPLYQIREQITNLCINVLHSYRKFCATVSSSGQLILPEGLKLLPLYTLALVKSIGLRTDGRIDDRSYWVSHVSSLSTPLVVPLVYPRMMAIHNLVSKEADESIIPPTIPLSSEYVTDDGIFLLESGEDCFIYVGNMANSDILLQIFGVPSVDEIPTQFVLKQYDNELSKKLNNVVNEIRRQRCSYLRLRLCKKGDPSGMLFFSYMIEDKTPGGLSYVEFLVHVHRQIQTKMA